MVIKASASAEVGALVEALSRGDDIHREAAVARLAVIGPRAVDRLMRAYREAADRATRLAILRVFEAIADHRTAPIARDALSHQGDVAVAAAGVLRSLLKSDNAAAAAHALDGLVSSALDPANDRRLRLAAIDALQDVPGDARDRVAAALASDPAREMRRAAETINHEAGEVDALWRDAIEGHLPDDPRMLREVVSARAATASLNALRKLIDAVRDREGRAQTERAGWRALRGSLHQALALRGSRVALYDLRESLEDPSSPLPVSFLAALHVLGDESCLEPLAARWSAASAPTSDGERWRHQLAETFRAIVRREKISRRHAALKRAAARHPDAAALWSS